MKKQGYNKLIENDLLNTEYRSLKKIISNVKFNGLRILVFQQEIKKIDLYSNGIKEIPKRLRIYHIKFSRTLFRFVH